MEYRLYADKHFTSKKDIKRFCKEWEEVTKEVRCKLNAKKDRYKYSNKKSA